MSREIKVVASADVSDPPRAESIDALVKIVGALTSLTHDERERCLASVREFLNMAPPATPPRWGPGLPWPRGAPSK